MRDNDNKASLKIAAALLVAGAVIGAVGQADALIAANGLSQIALNEQGGSLNGVQVRGIILPTR